MKMYDEIMATEDDIFRDLTALAMKRRENIFKLFELKYSSIKDYDEEKQSECRVVQGNNNYHLLNLDYIMSKEEIKKLRMLEMLAVRKSKNISLAEFKLMSSMDEAVESDEEDSGFDEETSSIEMDSELSLLHSSNYSMQQNKLKLLNGDSGYDEKSGHISDCTEKALSGVTVRVERLKLEDLIKWNVSDQVECLEQTASQDQSGLLTPTGSNIRRVPFVTLSAKSSTKTNEGSDKHASNDLSAASKNFSCDKFKCCPKSLPKTLPSPSKKSRTLAKSDKNSTAPDFLSCYGFTTKQCKGSTGVSKNANASNTNNTSPKVAKISTRSSAIESKVLNEQKAEITETDAFKDSSSILVQGLKVNDCSSFKSLRLDNRQTKTHIQECTPPNITKKQELHASKKTDASYLPHKKYSVDFLSQTPSPKKAAEVLPRRITRNYAGRNDSTESACSIEAKPAKKRASRRLFNDSTEKQTELSVENKIQNIFFDKLLVPGHMKQRVSVQKTSRYNTRSQTGTSKKEKLLINNEYKPCSLMSFPDKTKNVQTRSHALIRKFVGQSTRDDLSILVWGPK